MDRCRVDGTSLLNIAAGIFRIQASAGLLTMAPLRSFENAGGDFGTVEGYFGFVIFVALILAQE